MSEATKTSWQINSKVNVNLLEHLNDEMLSAQSPGGNMSVAQRLVHLVDAVRFWGCYFDAARFFALPDLVGDSRCGLTQTTLRYGGDAAALEASLAAADKGRLFDSIGTLLIHIVSHDAHHRGQIVLAPMSTALPGDDAIWSPWRGG